MQFISGMPIYETIEQIVSDLQNEVQGNGVLRDVKPTGNNIMVTCPIHNEGQENKPSCGITAHEMRRHNGSKLEAGTVNCFTCGYVASLPEFISNVLGYDDRGRSGFKWLAGRYHSVKIEHRKPIQILPKKEKIQQTKIIEESELVKYRYAHPYMYRRGLCDKFIEIFDIGYCIESDSITFPIKNNIGECLFIQKRSVQGKRFENDKNASKSTLYGIDVLNRLAPNASEITIVESPIDVITLWQWGIPALGTLQAIPTQQQLDIINRLPAKSIILAQDNDEAGEVGATRMREKIKKVARRVIFPSTVKDVNEVTKEEYLAMEKSVVFGGIKRVNKR